mgnify:CR=1 FL=1
MPFFTGHPKYLLHHSEETKTKISVANSKPKVQKVCIQCKKQFGVWPSRSQTNHCSNICALKSRRGRPAWNKGLVGWRLGENHPWIPKGEKHWSYGKKRLDITGEKHPDWKGEKVSYRNLHRWVERNLGKPKFCEDCKNRELEHRQYHWSNVSGKYKRIFSDWRRRCVKCHLAHDRKAKSELPRLAVIRN